MFQTPAMTKTLGAWSVGNNGGLLAPGATALANGNWYHLYAAIVNGSPDYFADFAGTAIAPTNARTPAHMPTGTTLWRRIMSFRAKSTTQFWQWSMTARRQVLWADGHVEISGGAAQFYASLNFVPPGGLRPEALISYVITNSVTSVTGDLFAPDGAAGWTIWTAANTWNGGQYTLRLDKTNRIGANVSTAPNSNEQLDVNGWYDPTDWV
jgi:prepilin-type processing-associated H-X9-DG protein